MTTQLHDNLSQSQAGGIDIGGMVALITRLAEVMSEEILILRDMKLGELEETTEEKRKLVAALEVQKREIDKNPHFLTMLDKEELETLQEVDEIYREICEENRRQLFLAREVNAIIVNTVAEAIKSDEMGQVYHQSGTRKADNPRNLTGTAMTYRDEA